MLTEIALFVCLFATEQKGRVGHVQDTEGLMFDTQLQPSRGDHQMMLGWSLSHMLCCYSFYPLPCYTVDVWNGMGEQAWKGLGRPQGLLVSVQKGLVSHVCVIPRCARVSIM